MPKLYFIIAFSLCLIACRTGSINDSQAAVSLPTITPTPTLSPKPALIPLDKINLAKMGDIEPAGRVQDKDYNKNLPVVDALLAHGKDAIPYLISKLDDGTKINDHVMDYWYEIHIGDVAFIILTDFFLAPDWDKGTIPGVGWDEFLGRGGNKDITASELYYNYLAEHGRKGLKARWQRIWAAHQDKVYWDEAGRCFRLSSSE